MRATGAHDFPRRQESKFARAPIAQTKTPARKPAFFIYSER